MTEAPARPSVDITLPEESVAVPSGVDASDTSWVPDLNLVCGERSCPLQVGLLVFLSPPRKGTVNFKRCTAFLIAPNLIMSNGHCDNSPTGNGYFITQKIRGTALRRKIVSVTYKRYTPNPENLNSTSGMPDVAIYEGNTAFTHQGQAQSAMQIIVLDIYRYARFQQMPPAFEAVTQHSLPISSYAGLALTVDRNRSAGL